MEEPSVKPFRDGEPGWGAQFDAMVAGHVRRGVVSGCAVSAQSPASMNLDVAAGTTLFDNEEKAVTAGSVTIEAANTFVRYDLVVVDDADNLSVLKGSLPMRAVELPSNRVLLAVVEVHPGVTEIEADNIVDGRLFVEGVPEADGPERAIQFNDGGDFTGADGLRYTRDGVQHLLHLGEGNNFLRSDGAASTWLELFVSNVRVLSWNTSGTALFEADGQLGASINPTITGDNNTAIDTLRWIHPSGSSPRTDPVTVGDADTAGAGWRALRVPNGG